MNLAALIAEMRRSYDGFNQPATDVDMARLEQTIGPLPDDVRALYRDHDGADEAPRRGEHWLPVRLMSTDEALRPPVQLDGDEPAAGAIAWLFTDDNSNYVGVYTSGPLQGWLVMRDHEEPILAPAWRCVAAFLQHLLASAPGTASEDAAAYDAVSVPRELPVAEDDPAHREHDLHLAQQFHDDYAAETDPDRRRFYAQCSITLTPVIDTERVLAYLDDDDMWTPESALALLERRRYQGPVDAIERVARDGRPNGDAAAMRLLVRMRTPASEAAVARLGRELVGPKKQSLELWLVHRDQ